MLPSLREAHKGCAQYYFIRGSARNTESAERGAGYQKRRSNDRSAGTNVPALFRRASAISWTRSTMSKSCSPCATHSLSEFMRTCPNDQRLAWEVSL
jgi:hypothetical protein